MPIFYINLDTRPERRKFMERQFEDLGLVADRIRGTTPAELTDEERNQYCNPNRWYWLSEAQFACSKAHTHAWEALIATGARRGLVLEDDVVLSSDIKSFLEQLPEFDVDVIRIEDTDAPQLNAGLLEQKCAGRGFRRMSSFTWGSAGYVISRTAAQALLASPQLFNYPLDWTLFCTMERPANRLRLLQTDPAVCAQHRNLESHEDEALDQSDNDRRPPPTSFTARVAHVLRITRWRLIHKLEPVLQPHMKRRKVSFRQD